MANISEDQFAVQMEIREKLSDLINLLGDLTEEKVETIEYLISQLNEAKNEN